MKKMKIEFDEADKEYILNALTARMREIGANYSNTYAQGFEMRALKVAAQQLGYDFETVGGNTSFTVQVIERKQI